MLCVCFSYFRAINACKHLALPTPAGLVTAVSRSCRFSTIALLGVGDREVADRCKCVSQTDYGIMHSQETAAGILFLDGSNSDKSAPNTCLVACKPESVSGDAKDCPYHFLLHMNQVQFSKIAHFRFQFRERALRSGAISKPADNFEMAMSCFAVLVLLIVWVGVVCRCDSVIDLMLAHQLPHFPPFFVSDRLLKIAGGCHLFLLWLPLLIIHLVTKNCGKKNAIYHAC